MLVTYHVGKGACAHDWALWFSQAANMNHQFAEPVRQLCDLFGRASVPSLTQNYGGGLGEKKN